MKYRKEVKDNEVVESFDRIKWKMYKRYERAEYGINQKPSEKDLSYTEILPVAGSGDQGEE